MGMNKDKASGVVTHAPRILFADSSFKELAKFGMPLITAHPNDCLNDTKMFDMCHCMGIVFY
jgi:site-specific recombinase